MLSYEESLKILKETNALIEGHFILSSGLHSSRYVQCAQLLSKPHLASKICISLSEKIKSIISDFDLIQDKIKKNIYLIEQKLNFTFKDVILILNVIIRSGIRMTISMSMVEHDYFY